MNHYVSNSILNNSIFINKISDPIQEDYSLLNADYVFQIKEQI